MENYPLKTVILANLVSLGIYFAGLTIIYHFGLIFSLFFLVYIILLEFRLLRYHCINCYYWGKSCGFGKGKISALLFPKGDISKFCRRSMSWSDMIPDLVLSLLPVLTGIFLLINEFRFLILISILLIIFLTTFGNNYIRGILTCKNCKQKEYGCPAYDLFNKKG